MKTEFTNYTLIDIVSVALNDMIKFNEYDKYKCSIDKKDDFLIVTLNNKEVIPLHYKNPYNKQIATLDNLVLEFSMKYNTDLSTQHKVVDDSVLYKSTELSVTLSYTLDGEKQTVKGVNYYSPEYHAMLDIIDKILIFIPNLVEDLDTDTKKTAMFLLGYKHLNLHPDIKTNIESNYNYYLGSTGVESYKFDIEVRILDKIYSLMYNGTGNPDFIKLANFIQDELDIKGKLKEQGIELTDDMVKEIILSDSSSLGIYLPDNYTFDNIYRFNLTGIVECVNSFGSIEIFNIVVDDYGNKNWSLTRYKRPEKDSLIITCSNDGML